MPKTKQKEAPVEALKLPVRDSDRERFKVPDLKEWTLEFNAASITGLADAGFNFRKMQDYDVTIVNPLIFWSFHKNHKFTVKTMEDAKTIWAGYKFLNKDGEDGGIFNTGVHRLIELFTKEASIIPNEDATEIIL